MKTKHRKVSIVDYEAHTGMYESPLCDRHQAHPVTDVCSKCNELLCFRCDPKGYCPSLIPSEKKNWHHTTLKLQKQFFLEVKGWLFSRHLNPAPCCNNTDNKIKADKYWHPMRNYEKWLLCINLYSSYHSIKSGFGDLWFKGLCLLLDIVTIDHRGSSLHRQLTQTCYQSIYLVFRSVFHFTPIIVFVACLQFSKNSWFHFLSAHLNEYVSELRKCTSTFKGLF